MSIFGRSYPKFVCGSNTVLLEHSNVNMSSINNVIEHTSLLNSTITKLPQGVYVEATIILNLNKYAEPMAKFNEVNAYKHKTVDAFYQYSDGNPFYVSKTTNYCPFYISQVTPKYIDDTLYIDSVTIKLKSTQYCYIVPTDEPLPYFITGYGYNYGTNYGRQL